MPLPENLLQLHARMISIDTVSTPVSGRPYAEEPLAQELAAIASAMGFQTIRQPTYDGFADNLVVMHTAPAGGGAKPWLLFESHMDTVSVDGMTIEPFAAAQRGSRVYGRGACDTKGTGAAMLWAMHRYAQSETQPHNIALLFAVNEEAGMHGARAFAARGLDALGFMPRLCVVGEPTMLSPVVAHNGVMAVDIETHGRACHASDPSMGVSAISMMAHVIDTVERNYIATLQATHDWTGKAQCSINRVHGGAALNIVPDACTCSLDRRLVPGEDAAAVVPAIEAVLEGLELPSGQPIRASVHDRGSAPPLTPAAGEGTALSAVQQVLSAHGLGATPQGAAYGTDAGFINQAGVPCVVLGPGDIAQAHTADEWIAIDQLELGCDVYEAIMKTDAFV